MITTLRTRAARAVCALHPRADRIDICEVGARTTDAVLTEVSAWIREQAAVTADRPAAAALAGLADLVDARESEPAHA